MPDQVLRPLESQQLLVPQRGQPRGGSEDAGQRPLTYPGSPGQLGQQQPVRAYRLSMTLLHPVARSLR